MPEVTIPEATLKDAVAAMIFGQLDGDKDVLIRHLIEQVLQEQPDDYRHRRGETRLQAAIRDTIIEHVKSIVKEWVEVNHELLVTEVSAVLNRSFVEEVAVDVVKKARESIAGRF